MFRFSYRCSLILLSAALLLTGCKKSQEQDSLMPTDSSELSAISADSSQAAAEESSELTFEAGDIRALEQSEDSTVYTVPVTQSADGQRPSSFRGNEVFLGWKPAEQEDSAASAVAYGKDISELPNVVYNDAVYAKCGGGTFSVPVILGGQAHFSMLELEIDYDPAVLTFDSFAELDADAQANCKEAGKILLSLTSVENIEADVSLCTICFRPAANAPAETLLQYQIKDIAAWDTDGKTYRNAQKNTVSGRIVLIK